MSQTQTQPEKDNEKLEDWKKGETYIDRMGFFRRDSDDSDPEEDQKYSSDSDEDDKVVKQIKAYYLQKTNTHSLKCQQQLLQENKKINLNYFDAQLEMSLNNKVNSALKTSQVKQDDERIRIKDKNDRATVDQVLDPRTLIVLHKMVKNQKLDKIYGCLSTGKEANVYLAETSMDLNKMELFDPSHPKQELAIKVFKTSILIFKDRERYVSGEFRFRKGHCKSNPRKMVQLWAEKEVRNLKRLNQTNGLIKAPTPYLLRNNIIVMEFIGENGQGAPRLKDANIVDIQQTYIEILFIMRRMYQMCKLVHADFSEYNLLYYKEEVYVIDVSQSVEHDHPMALEFLRRDCANINDFFKKKGLKVLSIHQIFDFITSLNIDNENSYLEQEFSKIQVSGYKEEEDGVFQNIYIPRTLQELSIEEIEKQTQQKDEIYYDKLTGIDVKEKKEVIKEEIMEEGKSESESEGEDDEDEEQEENTNKKQSVSLTGMTKEQKKEHKRKVKEEKREKRKQKLPKHIKKKAEKKNKQN